MAVQSDYINYKMCIFVIVYMFTLVLDDVSIESCDLVGYYVYYILLVYDHLYPLQDCVCSNIFASAEPIFNPNICVRVCH